MSRRTFDVTVRAEIERGQLLEWCKENLPHAAIVRVEESNLEGSK